jgi:hypothetical protein
MKWPQAAGGGKVPRSHLVWCIDFAATNPEIDVGCYTALSPHAIDLAYHYRMIYSAEPGAWGVECKQNHGWPAPI